MVKKTLRELFHDTLKDIYFAEKKILGALPKMTKAAQAHDLKAAFQKHEAETKEHVARLEKVFAEIDQAARGKTCEAILGIMEEGQEIMKEYKGIRLLTPASLRRRRLSSTTKFRDTEPSRHGHLSSD
jgi:ferritin-like metal-binding protein YciE